MTPPIHWCDPVRPANQRGTFQRGWTFAEVEYPSGTRRAMMFGVVASSIDAASRSLELIADLASRGILRQDHRRRRYRTVRSVNWTTKTQLPMENQRIVGAE